MAKKNIKYILDTDGRTPIPCPTLSEWARWFEHADKKRVVGSEDVALDGVEVTVSTIFLGLDHDFESGEPILFETLVFIGKSQLSDDENATLEGLGSRYRTWDEAELGHADAVQAVKDTLLAQKMNRKQK